MDSKTTAYQPHSGIPVRMADIQPFAKRKCPYCWGKGERWASKPVRKTVPCTCGLSAFLKVQRCVQNRKTGQLFFVEPLVAWSEASRVIHAAAQSAPEVIP